jgi:hypothetical protein
MKTFYINNKKNNHVNEYTNSDNDHYSDLISYTTRVASYNHATNEISIYNAQSQTTISHINDFLEFYGFDRQTKQQLLNQI